MAAGSSVSPDEAPRVHLLPGFDEYLLGYRDRSAALNPVHASKIVPGNNGMFMPTLVSDGRVVGTWRRTLKKRAVTATAQPFDALSAVEEDAFTTAAERYGRFLAMPVTTG